MQFVKVALLRLGHGCFLLRSTFRLPAKKLIHRLAPEEQGQEAESAADLPATATPVKLGTQQKAWRDNRQCSPSRGCVGSCCRLCHAVTRQGQKTRAVQGATFVSEA